MDMAAEFPSLGDMAKVKREKDQKAVQEAQAKARARALEMEKEMSDKKEKEDLEDRLKKTAALPPQEQRRLNQLRLQEERAAFELQRQKEELTQSMYVGALRHNKNIAQKVAKPATLLELEKEENERLTIERTEKKLEVMLN